MSTPSILTPLQRDFLRAFFAHSPGQTFFLTGGTALAEFYLHHRYSEDVDLFTLERDSLDAMERDLPNIAAEIGCTWSQKIKVVDFRSVILQRPSEPSLKIDLVRDVGPQFGEHRRFGNIVVDSQLNIAVNKLTALFGRAAPKDFVDLYFILKQGTRLDELMEFAKEKDPGFSGFYLAGMMWEIEKDRALPRMIQPITIEELRAFFIPLAEQLMLKLKPRE